MWGVTLYAQPLRTARLNILPLQPEYAREMAGVLSDPALHTFIGGSPLDARDLRDRYECLTAGSPDPAVVWCNWVLRVRQERRLVGTVQATVRTEGAEAEIAWVVGASWQGHGYATEAARALVTWLTEHPSPVRTITAHVHPGHHASAAVARAAGLHPTGEEHEGEIRWRLEH